MHMAPEGRGSASYSRQSEGVLEQERDGIVRIR